MDIRFYILDALNASGNHCAYIDLLNTMQRDHNIPGTVTRALLKEMTKERLVSGAFKAYGGVRLESAGLALYSQTVYDQRCAEADYNQLKADQEAADTKREQELTSQMAHERTQKRKDKRFDILKILLGAALTLLVEVLLKFVF